MVLNITYKQYIKLQETRLHNIFIHSIVLSTFTYGIATLKLVETCMHVVMS